MFQIWNPILCYPVIPSNCDLPPTLYSLMESIVNFGKEEKTKIKDLAKESRSTIFDFDYPLSTHVSKEDFECMILNHFIMRRIGYDTLTAFKIALNTKLNSIMPIYNKMFDMLDNWDIFNDGEIVERSVTEVGSSVDVNNGSSTNSVANTSNSTNNRMDSASDTSDRRFSDTPENQLTDVQNGTYLTNYNYDHNTASNSTTDVVNSTNNTSNIISTNNTNNSNNSNNITERVTHTPSDKMRLYLDFMNNYNSIYEEIFKKLDPLFYGLV